MAEKDPDLTPANAALIRDFVNTLHVHDGRDDDGIATPELLRDWLRDNGLLIGPDTPTPEEHELALKVREAIRDLAEGNSGGTIEDACIDCLNRAATAARLVVRFEDDGSSRLKAAAPGVSGALGYVLSAMFTSMTDGSWTRMKICRDRACRWMFFDQSRNRSGTWCSMESCGNRAKVRSFRARHAHV